jgi:hypothetical protein
VTDRAPRTTTIGSRWLGPDGEIGVVVENTYAVDGTQPSGFNELGNRLQMIGSPEDVTLVDVPISRDDCLRLAEMFLDAALSQHWPT